MGLFDTLFRKKATTPVLDLRAVLFADAPLDAWPALDDSVSGAPWDSFTAARGQVAAGELDQAKASWRQVLQAPKLATRHYLQAWHFLRAQGEQPAENVARQVLGVVLEVALPKGVDQMAVYADCTARYYSHTGVEVAWSQRDHALEVAMKRVFEAARTPALQGKPHKGERPALPPRGHVRLSLLTPSGLIYNQSPMDELAHDDRYGRVLQCANDVMKRLAAKRERGPGTTANLTRVASEHPVAG